jgi:BolA protein
MAMADRISERLRAAFEPELIEVEDESHRHHGHGGWREGGNTHFRVRLVAARFAGQSRVARHRLVNDALKAEFADGVHALALDLKAPGE